MTSPIGLPFLGRRRPPPNTGGDPSDIVEQLLEEALQGTGLSGGDLQDPDGGDQGLDLGGGATATAGARPQRSVKQGIADALEGAALAQTFDSDSESGIETFLGTALNTFAGVRGARRESQRSSADQLDALLNRELATKRGQRSDRALNLQIADFRERRQQRRLDQQQATRETQQAETDSRSRLEFVLSQIGDADAKAIRESPMSTDDQVESAEALLAERRFRDRATVPTRPQGSTSGDRGKQETDRRRQDRIRGLRDEILESTVGNIGSATPAEVEDATRKAELLDRRTQDILTKGEAGKTSRADDPLANRRTELRRLVTANAQRIQESLGPDDEEAFSDLQAEMSDILREIETMSPAELQRAIQAFAQAAGGS